MKATKLHFAVTSLRMGAGLLIWALHFSGVYIYAAMMCARGAAHVEWLGVNVVGAVIALMTLVALAALAYVIERSLRGNWYADAHANGQPFIAWISAAMGVYGAVAVLWAALPAIWVSPCH